MDFLALLCGKIGLFGCPRAIVNHTGQTQLQCKQVLQGSELQKRTPPPQPPTPAVTSILPMSLPGASGPGYVQTIVSSEESAYRGKDVVGEGKD